MSIAGDIGFARLVELLSDLKILIKLYDKIPKQRGEDAAAEQAAEFLQRSMAVAPQWIAEYLLSCLVLLLLLDRRSSSYPSAAIASIILWPLVVPQCVGRLLRGCARLVGLPLL